MKPLNTYQIAIKDGYRNGPSVIIAKMKDTEILRTFRRSGITVPTAPERAVYVEAITPRPNIRYVLDGGQLWECRQWHEEQRQAAQEAADLAALREHQEYEVAIGARDEVAAWLL